MSTLLPDPGLERRINRVRVLVVLLLLALSALSRWLKGPDAQLTFVLEACTGGAALLYGALLGWLCRRGEGRGLPYFAVTMDFVFIAALLFAHSFGGQVRVLGTLEFYHALLDTVFLLVFVENSLNALRRDAGVAIYCACLGAALTLGFGLYSAYGLGIPGTLVDTIMRLVFVVATALIPIAGSRRAATP